MSFDYRHPCVHCKKRRGEHLADKLNCPTGPKTRIGRIDFHPKNKFTPKSNWKLTKKMLEQDAKNPFINIQVTDKDV